MSFKTGDILILKTEIICQGVGVTITYGLIEGNRVPVLVLPTEHENMLDKELRDAIAVLRKRSA